MSGPIRRDASSDESNFVGATGGDPRVGRVDESNTQPPRRSLVSGPVGATRRTTAERVESTVELCRSDKSTGRYDSKTRVGPRRVASGRAWTWLMSPKVTCGPPASVCRYHCRQARLVITFIVSGFPESCLRVPGVRTFHRPPARRAVRLPARASSCSTDGEATALRGALSFRSECVQAPSRSRGRSALVRRSSCRGTCSFCWQALASGPEQREQESAY